MWKKLTEYILFGNVFYGICAVALCIEAAFQLHIPLNHPLFYAVLLSGSVVYYTYAYINEKYVDTHNKRAVWYHLHPVTVTITQALCTIVAVAGSVYLLWRYRDGMQQIPAGHWLIALAFPLAAAFYYEIPVLRLLSLNLRRTGWMKPFVIGFVWAGAVTIYPLLWYEIESGAIYPYALITGWLVLKNWMFITVLCIMFDIKDYASDSNNQLKTFVVRVGLRKTIFNIIIPLTLAGMVSFFLFAWFHHFVPVRSVCNIIPFILLIVVAYSLHQRKNILYYLAIIDGLMLVKAICGILGTVLTK